MDLVLKSEAGKRRNVIEQLKSERFIHVEFFESIQHDSDYSLAYRRLIFHFVYPIRAEFREDLSRLNQEKTPETLPRTGSRLCK